MNGHQHESQDRYGDEQVPGEVHDRLRAAAASARPSGPVAPVLRAAVRRRRRQRAAGAGVLASALVAGVVGVAVALPGGGQGVDPAAAPETSTSSPTRAPQGGAFTCSTESRVFGETPPIPDLEEQQRLVRSLSQGHFRRISAYAVRHAEPTALGVVALVIGSEQLARQSLTRLGVALVESYDASAADAGVDDHGQVQQVLQWQLEPVVREVQTATRGIPGDAGIALWQEAGAVLLQWKTPVPDEVQALAGSRDNGVEVIVEGVTYSRADVRDAQARLEAWLQGSGRRDDWSSAYGCADGSGLVVGMVPGAADEPGLAAEIEAAVGMPVLVVPEERPVEMLPQEDVER
ncbi:hypothetical protein [Nocardioides ferulae]|uniref:hypothetical protein n=1 Tax=Nocardioides ferulae TaxID=2340821 RepID=UPI000EB4442D|nr:hypothetical protein [Nocardioides ferulae]